MSTASLRRYSELLDTLRLAEPPPGTPPKRLSEHEVQALWFAGLLGRSLTTTTGETLHIADFGRWNHEAGPDFQDVVIRWPDGRVQKGPVELDRDPRDWERHGHAANPAFDPVILHLYWEEPPGARVFTRSPSNRLIPQARVPLAASQEFSLTAPPAPARPGRCAAPLAALQPGRASEILLSAARHRLAKKAARFQRAADARGPDEALFMLTAEALGYRDNKLPMMLLAQRLPIATLRAEGPAAAALLFGAAGFLERDRPASDPPGPALAHYRSLWESWWPRRSRFAHLILSPRHWRAAGRPQNHPQRRLAALALLAANWRAWHNRLSRSSPAGLVSWLAALDHPFWSFHYTLTSPPSPKPLALIGPERARDIFANVAAPYRFATRGESWDAHPPLPGAALNSKLKTAAIRLFGPAAPQIAPKLTLPEQQGLLQIYEDFCLHDQTACEHCPFPELLARW